MRRIIGSIRKVTAAPVAMILAKLLRMEFLGASARQRLWDVAEKYVNFYDVKRQRPTIFGDRMDVSTAKMVEKQIFYFGEWEPHFSRYLISKPNSDGVFLDIGSNIGYFSLLAAGRYRHVYAIEASPRIYARLMSNVKANNVSNVEAFNVAVGDESGMADFYYNTVQSGGSSLLEGEGRVLDGTVKVERLFDIVPQSIIPNVRFMKIDIEGFEHFALDEIIKYEEKLRDDVEIMLEYDPTRAAQLLPRIEALKRLGFNVYFLQGHYEVTHYLDVNMSPQLTPISTMPADFSDIILSRM